MIRTVIAWVLATSLAGCAAPSAPPRPAFLSSPAHEALGLPFSEAVRVGNTLYLSGQLGTRPGTMELVTGGVGPETAQTLDNIRATLERYGASLGDVVKCTIFLADIADWPAMNDVYRTYFTAGRMPARSAVAGSGLGLGARVEIDCIAVLR